MSDPIISPWIFYAVSVCTKLTYISQFVAYMAWWGCPLLAFLIFMPLLGEPEGVEKYVSKWAKRGCILSILFALIALFVPDKEVLYQMLAASLITPDNIIAVQGNIVQFISDIAKGISEASK